MSVTIETPYAVVSQRQCAGESIDDTVARCWLILNNDMVNAQRMITLGHVRRNMDQLGCVYPRAVEREVALLN